ncbi:DUF4244 domain-containing protein [Pseudonocardia humida]|uniref:DUF4244 domain-containing protein n=1 Tax=Pseudonocardia humida TaxID=2800819 RepID=A0ABT0ZU16_9PSEU|nr:DUF4244 domain-containing protein [Pseudonocardia humida]MCO1654199.1 DUF4244 domain-containing protein [Pseudonocardia humida]
MSPQPAVPGPTPPPVPRPTHLRLVPPPRRRRRWLGGDDGMSTVEYAIGTIAAAAFAALLYAVISGDTVLAALTDLVQRSLTAAF